MPDNDDYQEVLTATLRKIGRNLLNYQIVEKQWRLQIKFSRISSVGGVAKNSNSDSMKMPMGFLADKHTKSIFNPAENDSEYEEIDEITIHSTFGIEKDKESYKKRYDQVKVLVKERNALAHKLVDSFNHLNRESCLDFCKQLDEENERINAEIQYLNSISNGFVEICKFMQSDEFIDTVIKLIQEEDAIRLNKK
jgi:hypothetical protein